MSDLIAVVLAALALFAGAYFALSAMLRRIPAAAARLPGEPIPAAWYDVVDHRVPLARGLPSEERERLLRLTRVFLAEKHFEGCGGLTVTEAMKVTIAAEACLLLLHLDGPCYPTLRTVLVYPGGFVPKFVHPPEKDGIARQAVPLMGQSWRDGVVVVSWDNVTSGAHDPADGRNVVLHEFAHQLDLEDGASDGAPMLWGSALRTWGRVLGGEYERLRRDATSHRASVLDPYGAESKAEFFAVATETFFEQPLQLEQEHPGLYAQLKQVYGQDPARRATAAGR